MEIKLKQFVSNLAFFLSTVSVIYFIVNPNLTFVLLSFAAMGAIAHFSPGEEG